MATKKQPFSKIYNFYGCKDACVIIEILNCHYIGKVQALDQRKSSPTCL